MPENIVLHRRGPRLGPGASTATNLLQRRRIDCGFTQYELASLIHRSGAYIGHVERGWVPPAPALAALGRVFGVSADTIREWIVTPPGGTEEGSAAHG